MTHLAMMYCSLAFGLGHLPIPLALRDDPVDYKEDLIPYYCTMDGSL
jgi:hypothetical protein